MRIASSQKTIAQTSGWILLAAAIFYGCVFHAELRSQPWNDVRMAVTMAMRKGIAIYSGPAEGPILGHMYGPLSAAAYLPATFFKTPGQVLSAGLMLAPLLTLIPAWWLLRVIAPRQPRKLAIAVVSLLLLSAWFRLCANSAI